MSGLTAAGKGSLSLEFHQKGNPTRGFQVQEFDLSENLANGLRLMLVVKEDRVERFMDDEQASSIPWKNLTDIVTGWFEPADTRFADELAAGLALDFSHDYHARMHQGLYRNRRSRAP